MTYEKHNKMMAEETARLQRQIDEARQRAKQFNSPQEVWEDMMKRKKERSRKKD